jgi:hypothetical protein
MQGANHCCHPVESHKRDADAPLCQQEPGTRSSQTRREEKLEERFVVVCNSARSSFVEFRNSKHVAVSTWS